ncbi:Ionotropic receptor 21a, partial [Pseudolycoriella hygida]
MSSQHSVDCAAFITLASKALPRYRAIMGPFQWPVWVAITLIYLIAIFPLAFSDKLTLSHLIGNWSEIENMFWYVFGTFTNSLSFTGKFSWSSSKKSSTRMLIGWYWVFTIIITACYTSSIIAFVTLPIFPETVGNDGWQFWFLNSSHAQTSKLIKNLELVADVEEGLSNVTKAWFFPYAFIGSKSQLEFIVRDNFTEDILGKRSALHIAEECLSIYGVSYMFPKDVVYSERLNDAILRIQAYGISNKMSSDMEWDLQRKSKKALLKSQGAKTFKVTESEERGLTLADTEGMFLLMGIGYVAAGSVLISEIIGGCANKCRKIARRESTFSFKSSTSHPNSRKTSRTDDIDEPVMSSLRNYSPDNFLQRRQSEQISGRTVTRRRHQRHNSLIDAEQYRANHYTSNSMPSIAGIDENDFIDNEIQTAHNGNGIHEFKAEVNRVPTPYFNTDDSFGEKIVH